MSSVRIANSYLSGALEVAAEYIQNGVRRATNDCVRKTPKVLVVHWCIGDRRRHPRWGKFGRVRSRTPLPP